MSFKGVKFETVKLYAQEHGIEEAVAKYGESFREELVKQLAGTPDPVGDLTRFTPRENIEETPKQEGKKGILLTLAALVGGIVGALITKTPGGAVGGAALVTTLFGTTSCGEYEYNPESPEIEIIEEKEENEEEKKGPTLTTIININVNVIINNPGLSAAEFAAWFNEALQKVIDAVNANGDKIANKLDTYAEVLIQCLQAQGLALSVIQELLEKYLPEIDTNTDQTNEILNQINDKLDKLNDIYIKLVDQEKQLGEIITILEKQGATLADVIAILLKNHTSIEKIIDVLQAQGKDLKTIAEELKKNGVKVDKVIELMESDIKLGETGNALVEKVFNAIVNLNLGNSGGDSNFDISGLQTILDSILDAIKKLPQENHMIQLGEDVAKAFNKLVDLINQFMTQEANMDAKEQELANTILTAINNLTLTGGGNGGDVTINVDLSKLENMLAELIEKAGKLDTTTEKIYEKLLAQGLNFDAIIPLLEEIKTTNYETNKKIEYVTSTIEALTTILNDMHKGTKDLLLQILDRIPKGCNCNNIDAVIEQLKIIIEIIQENPENNNEGIVNDLNNLLQ